jgi:hypothetical protein
MIRGAYLLEQLLLGDTNEATREQLASDLLDELGINGHSVFLYRTPLQLL